MTKKQREQKIQKAYQAYKKERWKAWQWAREDRLEQFLYAIDLLVKSGIEKELAREITLKKFKAEEEAFKWECACVISEKKKEMQKQFQNQ